MPGLPSRLIVQAVVLVGVVESFLWLIVRCSRGGASCV